MTPGLTRWNSEIKQSDVVAITSQNGVPMAVGVAAHNIGRLSKAVGEKGKAVYLVHCYNDELWALGSKAKPPVTLAADDSLEKATEELTLTSNVDDNPPLDRENASESTNAVRIQADTEMPPSEDASAESPELDSVSEPSSAGNRL